MLLTSQKYLKLFDIGSGSSKSLQVYVVKSKKVWQANVQRVDKPADRRNMRLWRSEQQRKSQSGWQADSWADRWKAGRQEARGGRLQREQTAGKLNRHTSVHDMSTPLTAGFTPVQRHTGSVSSVWFKDGCNSFPNMTLILLSIKNVSSQSSESSQPGNQLGVFLHFLYSLQDKSSVISF